MISPDKPPDAAGGNIRPLADRMRPVDLEQFVGQSHAVGQGTPIYHAVCRDRIFSMIFWGPPGCGKTTLARIMANATRSYFVQISAVLSGVKDIRSVIAQAKAQAADGRGTVLFVDEIHRFNKSQQDAFLHHVEDGLITLIGATTENPSFEVIPALLSRCRVITLNPLSSEEISAIVQKALKDPTRGLGRLNLRLSPKAVDYLVKLAGGDARVALNNLELVAAIAEQDGNDKRNGNESINTQTLQRALQKKALVHDKGGESHYNLISAFHKSLRGSDPDAALYWLARMLEAGEDPFYVARRMVRFASEDVGNADPNAVVVALNAMEAFRFLGHPEGELTLAQAALYLATAPKSNAVYKAYRKVQDEVAESGSLPVPMHIRNAPTGLMRDLGYGRGYQYAHDHKEAIVCQTYLPQALLGRRYYDPTSRGYENIVKKRLDKWRRLMARQSQLNGAGGRQGLRRGKPGKDSE